MARLPQCGRAGTSRLAHPDGSTSPPVQSCAPRALWPLLLAWSISATSILPTAAQISQPLVANVSIASYGRVFNGGDDCNRLWTYLGQSLTRNESSYQTYTCYVQTGQALPSIITLMITYSAAGMPSALMNNVKVLNSSGAMQTFMGLVPSGCQAEMYYTDTLSGAWPSAQILGCTVNTNLVSSVLMPGTVCNFAVNLGDCPSPSPPSPPPPPTPPPSPPIACTAQLILRTPTPIPSAPGFLDNCWRLAYYASQYFTLASMNPQPLCQDTGTDSGMVVFSFWVPSMDQYDILQYNMQFNILIARAIAVGFGLDCRSSLSMLSKDCYLPTVNINSNWFPSVFYCPPPPSPPPPPPPAPPAPPSPPSPKPPPRPPPRPPPPPPSPAPVSLSITLDFNTPQAANSYLGTFSCTSVSFLALSNLEGVGVTVELSNALCTPSPKDGRVSLIINIKGPDVAQRAVRYLKSSVGLASFKTQLFLPCSTKLILYSSATGVFNFVSCDTGYTALCCTTTASLPRSLMGNASSHPTSAGGWPELQP